MTTGLPGDVKTEWIKPDGLVEVASWQPIETAPKDGTGILAVTDGADLVIVSYDPYPGNRDWKEVGGEYYHRYNITHWMPLPPLPYAHQR